MCIRDSADRDGERVAKTLVVLDAVADQLVDDQRHRDGLRIWDAHRLSLQCGLCAVLIELADRARDLTDLAGAAEFAHRQQIVNAGDTFDALNRAVEWLFPAREGGRIADVCG